MLIETRPYETKGGKVTTISAEKQKLETIDKERIFLFKAECFLFQIETIVVAVKPSPSSSGS